MSVFAKPLEYLVQQCEDNVSGQQKDYKYSPSTAASVQKIQNLVAEQRESLTNDDPNTLEAEIIKRAIRINKSPKITFESR